MGILLDEQLRELGEKLGERSDVDGRARVVVEAVTPQIDGGRFAIKRVVGQAVTVRADVYNDGHDLPGCAVVYRHEDEDAWHESRMRPLGRDRWEAQFSVPQLGRYFYSVEAWIDRFRTWSQDFRKRAGAGQDVSGYLLIGADLVDEAARHAAGDDQLALRKWAQFMRDDATAATHFVLDAPDLQRLMERFAPRHFSQHYKPELPLVVEDRLAAFSAWYEMFPRSTALQPGRHGTFADCEDRLPDIAKMGFDILYLPPIHPIGITHRKGPNNQPHAEPQDVGSPWAIGGPEGGHKAIHPQLGSLEDFRHLVGKARELGIELALDIALQCSPDHPYVHRASGVVSAPPRRQDPIRRESAQKI